MNMRCLNVGCGPRFHADWVNVDIQPSDKQVQAHDLAKGIPFPDESFDVVYQSHVLEHLERDAADKLLRECRRVVKRDGILRVAVPDLEKIAQIYLRCLEEAEAGRDGAEAEYDWMMLEMYDQTVRERPGGAMLEFARNAEENGRRFLGERIGGELPRMLKVRNESQELADAQDAGRMSVRRAFLRTLIGDEGVAAYDLGRFRKSGEIHRWMYDRFSLRRALVRAGFRDVRRVGPSESSIPDWTGFHLDTEPDGSVYKPDSLFMEAFRA